MDLNLETLKTEIVDYLEHSDFAVFRNHPGALEELSMIAWDTERFPDYRSFLEVARKAGEKLIMFSSREFEADEVDEVLEELEVLDFARDERRDLEKRIRDAQRHAGEVCSIELAFDHNSNLYVYELRPDWYESFLDVSDEIGAVMPSVDGIDNGADGLGGFYSNN